MAKWMLAAILMLVLAAMLLPGCTINPQDLARQPASGGTGAPGAIGTGGGAQAAVTPGTAGASASPPANITLTASEVAKHNTASDCWMIIRGEVLDLSSFTSHPGGDAYIPYCGTDGTLAYEGKPHSANADSQLQYYSIGLLGQAAEPNTGPPPSLQGGDAEYEGELEDEDEGYDD